MYFRASPRVCYILLGKSCDLPTPKTIWGVKKKLSRRVCYFGLGKMKKEGPQDVLARTPPPPPPRPSFVVHSQPAISFSQAANSFSQPAISSSLPALSSTQLAILILLAGQQVFPAGVDDGASRGREDEEP
jgi:hypothetical protein